MNGVSATWVAAKAGAEILHAPGDDREGPARAAIDSRQVGRGDLFFGLAGSSQDGGRFAAAAIQAGCWGVVVTPEWVDEASRAAAAAEGGAYVLRSSDPLASLQDLARNWRRRLREKGTTLVGITGSVGKTSTKDISRALLPQPAQASEGNFNTEIGLPLSLIEADAGLRSLVLEMGMRGRGQIAELMAIADPDIGAITNVGPVHTELLGSIEAVAAAKAELLEGLPDGAVAVVPAAGGPLDPHITEHRDRLRILRFGAGGDVEAERLPADRGEARTNGISAEIRLSGAAAELAAERGGSPSGSFNFPFDSSHNLTNALAAVAIGLAAGASLEEMMERAGHVSFSRLRGERLSLGPGIEIVNDCYNANPVSMRAALTHLEESGGAGRRIAVLGLMAELGPESRNYHAEIGRFARERAGVDLLIGVGPEARWYEPDELVADPVEAAELLAEVAAGGDTVLIKGSRSAGLERVAEGLAAIYEAEGEPGPGGGQHG